MLPWSLPQTVCACKWGTPIPHETQLKPEAPQPQPQLAGWAGKPDSSLVLWPSFSTNILQKKESFSLATENALTTGLCTKKSGNSCCWFFSRTSPCSAAMKTTSDKKVFCFQGRNITFDTPKSSRKIFHFSFKMKNKLDEDFYQSKPNKHLWLLSSVVNKQTKYFIHLTLQAKANVSWHM